MPRTPPHQAQAPVLAITGSIRSAIQASGLSRSTLYQVIGAGKVRAVKRGAKTLIEMESLRQYLETLPPAKIRPSALRARARLATTLMLPTA